MVFENSMGECNLYLGDSYAGGVDDSAVVGSIATTITGGSKMNKCKFNKAWIGKCDKDVKDGFFCDEHEDEVCCVCGSQATRTCDATGDLVCGEYLCNDCTHTICANGCNSGASRPKGLGVHCKKSEQVFMSWLTASFITEALGSTTQILEPQNEDDMRKLREWGYLTSKN